MYSGPTAAYAYKALAEDRKPETAVIIGPNHTGIGPGISVFPEGEWLTPLGSASIDGRLARKIGFPDESAHACEHSAEVQVPFLQFLYGDIKIVPVCMLDQQPEASAALGKALAKALDPKKHVVIASTDFSHYVPYDRAYANDARAIAAIKKLDAAGLYDAVGRYDISMCGYGPVAAATAYAKAAGAKKGELLKYATSGDVSGDSRAVVGYAAMALGR
jgi:AmmeMemoRadiSam system protein B